MPAFETARILNVHKTFLRQLWATFESPVSRSVFALCPGGKQTHKVYMHIHKHRDVNKKSNSK